MRTGPPSALRAREYVTSKSGPVRAEQRIDGAGLDAKIDPSEHLETAVGLLQAGGLDRRVVGHGPYALSPYVMRYFA